MLRAWRNEIVCVGLAALALGLLGHLTGLSPWFLSAGAAGYLVWHAANFIRLQRWIARSDQFHVPVSAGIWEAVFDGLQIRQLRTRRQRRSLIRTFAEIREAAGRLPDALVALDRENRVQWFNKSAQRLLGLKRPDDVGRDIADLLRHPLLEDSLAVPGMGRSVEIPAPANAAWILNAHLTPAFGEDGGRMLVARDITPHHAVDQVRRDFITNVSHELRTPITVFRGFLDPLRSMTQIADIARPLALMDEQAQRMEHLVNDLLALSRLELGGRPVSNEVVPVADLLKVIIDEAEVLSGDQGHRLNLNADRTLGLRGDRKELYSAISNLVFNAVRHTAAGTAIDVSWQWTEDGPCVTVRDHGAGIPSQHLPRLTERFYRVDPARSRDSGGTGLGLAITKHVLERHGADLRIASQQGRGSTFVCQFPEHLAAEIEPEREARRA